MKRMLWALAVVGLTGMGTTKADWGGYGPPAPQPGGNQVQPAGGEFSAPNTLMGLGHNHAGKAPDRYGLLPGLRKAFRVNDGGCNSCGQPAAMSHPSYGPPAGYGPAYGQQPQYPPTMQGTLVFPNHQFVRSPRDFFMYEPGR